MPSHSKMRICSCTIACKRLKRRMQCLNWNWRQRWELITRYTQMITLLNRVHCEFRKKKARHYNKNLIESTWPFSHGSLALNFHQIIKRLKQSRWRATSQKSMELILVQLENWRLGHQLCRFKCQTKRNTMPSSLEISSMQSKMKNWNAISRSLAICELLQCDFWFN